MAKTEKFPLEEKFESLEQRVQALETLIKPLVGKTVLPIEHPAKGLNLYTDDEPTTSQEPPAAE